ncbi:hypothetical protein SERLA73DRAFT_50608, partial [Serpula lacrymans var. lacrymans S7.3]
SGGGVGGLTVALALSKHQDIEIDVYEAASQFTEIGAGVGIWPRGWAILQDLGLHEDLMTVGHALPTDEYVSAFVLRKSDQVVGLEFHDILSKGHLIRFHRAHFHGVLLKHLPSTCRTHCSKRLKTYKQPDIGPIQLYFQDGSTASCDVLIGADGVKSVVRTCMLQEQADEAARRGDLEMSQSILSCIEPVWSGFVAYRTLISSDKLRKQAPNHRALTTPTQYLGKDAYILVYPVSKGESINFVGFCFDPNHENTTFSGPWVREMTREEVAVPFAEFEPEAKTLIECIDKANLWAIYTVKPLHAMNFRRVTLLGDSAHSMVPSQGAGAGQAIEDACVLAKLLGHKLTNIESVCYALAVYNEIRLPFTKDIAHRSYEQGKLSVFQGIEFDGCNLDDVRARLALLGDRLNKNWDWAWLTTIDDSLQKAILLLENGVPSVPSML